MTLSHLFEKLSYWNETICIRSNNLDLIEQALTHIFGQKDYRRIPKPPLPQNPSPIIEELRFRTRDIEPYLLVIGLFVGNLGWTIIKTSPTGLLCRRARGFIRPRLSQLAMQTGCDAFLYGVHNRHWGALLEANASGRTKASGYLDGYDDVEKMMFHDEWIAKQTVGAHFLLLDVPLDLRLAGRPSRVRINDEERRIKLEQLEVLFEQGDEQAANAWSEWGELNKGGFESADKALRQVLSGENNYWYEHNLLYKVYAESQ